MKSKFIISCFLILCSAFASSNIGAGLVFGQRGTGVHLSNDWKVNQKFYLGLELRFLDIKNENEQTAVDYFTGYPYTVGNRALAMFPIYAKFRWLPFEGKIENNFSPFFGLKIGPNFVLDGNENEQSFRSRWFESSESYISFGTQLVFGISFVQPSGAIISPSIGYEFLPLNQRLDGRDNYDGFTINLNFIRNKSR